MNFANGYESLFIRLTYTSSQTESIYCYTYIVYVMIDDKHLPLHLYVIVKKKKAG